MANENANEVTSKRNGTGGGLQLIVYFTYKDLDEQDHEKQFLLNISHRPASTCQSHSPPLFSVNKTLGKYNKTSILPQMTRGNELTPFLGKPFVPIFMVK
jgi:hypothetical protein